MELRTPLCDLRPFRMSDAPSLARHADNRKIWLELRLNSRGVTRWASKWFGIPMRPFSFRALLLAAGLLLPGCRDVAAPEGSFRDAFAATAYAAPCARPAPLLGTYTPDAPGIIVQFHPGIAVDAEVARLSEAYAFTPRFVYTHALQGFAAEVPAATIAALRCERSVREVEWDSIFSTG